MAEVAVEVVYAEPGRAWRVAVVLERGATVEDAVSRSGLVETLRLPIDRLGFGVYGRACRADHVLAAGDRVELYRPLEVSPKEARLLRARGARGAR